MTVKNLGVFVDQHLKSEEHKSYSNTCKQSSKLNS